MDRKWSNLAKINEWSCINPSYRAASPWGGWCFAINSVLVLLWSCSFLDFILQILLNFLSDYLIIYIHYKISLLGNKLIKHKNTKISAGYLMVTLLGGEIDALVNIIIYHLVINNKLSFFISFFQDISRDLGWFCRVNILLLLNIAIMDWFIIYLLI